MTPSPFICERCLLPVRQWGRSDNSTYWKHSGGGGSGRSCGRTPIPIDRARYEAAMVKGFKP